MKYWLAVVICLMCACSNPSGDTSQPVKSSFIDLSKRDKPSAITQNPWEEVVTNVTDFSHVTGLFVDIADFEIRDQSEKFMLLAARDSDAGYIRVNLLAQGTPPARPPTSAAWDKGCYFSLMLRAKNLETIIRDARDYGWKPHTEMAYLEFGPSKLHIVVLTHDSGLRVQLYERLTTSLPEAFPGLSVCLCHLISCRWSKTGTSGMISFSKNWGLIHSFMARLMYLRNKK